MDANDFAFIEKRLNVVLPTVFKDFMSSYPNDPGHQLRNACDKLACNGELFVINQLKNFFYCEGEDFYELQPELKPCRFIEIGGDGCGNFYCMVGDDEDSNDLWMWEHDPYNGLRKCKDVSLAEYLTNGNWALASCPDPFVTTTGTYVIRTNHPVRAIFEPIAMEEWLKYVEVLDFVDLDENVVVQQPFTNETLVFRRWPGRAKLFLNGSASEISYSHGALYFGENTLPLIKSHAERIAVGLNAHVWSDR